MNFFKNIRRMIRIYTGLNHTEYMTNHQIDEAIKRHKDMACSCGAKDFFISTEVHYLRTYDVTQGKPLYCVTCQKCGQVTTYRYHHAHEVSLGEADEMRHEQRHLETSMAKLMKSRQKKSHLELVK